MRSDAKIYRSMSDAEFICARSQVDEKGCWIASGNYGDGYGGFQRNGQRRSAHRWAYEVFIGPIPNGLLVRHRCDNRRCCNPDHLELGSHADNHQDMMQRHPNIQAIKKENIAKARAHLGNEKTRKKMSLSAKARAEREAQKRKEQLTLAAKKRWGSCA